MKVAELKKLIATLPNQADVKIYENKTEEKEIKKTKVDLVTIEGSNLKTLKIFI